MAQCFDIGGDGTPQTLPNVTEFAVNLERYFAAGLGTLPRQTWNTYEHLSRAYLNLRSQGKTQTEILRALQAQAPALGVSGDATTVAATVVSAGRAFIDKGQHAEAPTAPSFEEIIDDYSKDIKTGVGKVTKALPWYLHPVTLGLGAVAVYFGPGMLARYLRARRRAF